MPERPNDGGVVSGDGCTQPNGDSRENDGFVFALWFIPILWCVLSFLVPLVHDVLWLYPLVLIITWSVSAIMSIFFRRRAGLLMGVIAGRVFAPILGSGLICVLGNEQRSLAMMIVVVMFVASVVDLCVLLMCAIVTRRIVDVVARSWC